MSREIITSKLQSVKGLEKATLIVGVDVGKAFNALGFMDKRARY